MVLDTSYVPSGVHQGSVLEPRLRNVSINYPPDAIESSKYLLLILADDIKIFPNASSTSDSTLYL
jgi:hypothetical protein